MNARVEASVVLSRPPDDEVAFAVDMASLCRALQVLPRSGGILDQDWYHVALLRAALRAFHIKEEREAEAARHQ